MTRMLTCDFLGVLPGYNASSVASSHVAAAKSSPTQVRNIANWMIYSCVTDVWNLSLSDLLLPCRQGLHCDPCRCAEHASRAVAAQDHPPGPACTMSAVLRERLALDIAPGCRRAPNQRGTARWCGSRAAST